jgi:hypothetical protein
MACGSGVRISREVGARSLASAHSLTHAPSKIPKHVSEVSSVERGREGVEERGIVARRLRRGVDGVKRAEDIGCAQTWGLPSHFMSDRLTVARFSMARFSPM